MAARARSARIGVISDTHGLLRPEALRSLRGVDLIVHAGDVGAPEVLSGLRAIARVVAVRGNNDRGAWARALRETVTFTVAGARVHVVHDVKALALDPVKARIDVVIAGHSHRPVITKRDGVLYLNPGSAGPRRFSLPVTVARLRVQEGRISAQIAALRLTRAPG